MSARVVRTTVEQHVPDAYRGKGWTSVEETDVPWPAGTPVVIVDAETWERAMRLLGRAIDCLAHERMCSTCAEDGCRRCRDCEGAAVADEYVALLSTLSEGR